MGDPSVPGAGWLYVRGNSSVLIIRSQAALLVYGPGIQRDVYTAHDDETAHLLQQRLEADLRARGWILEGYGVERRGRRDRRRVPRWTERRGNWQN